MTITTLHGDCRDVLSTLPERSVQCVVTSPPYYGLRRYSDDPREIGQEAQPDCLAWARRESPCGACYVCAMRDVFASVWRVLRDDGTVWLNLGDSYIANTTGSMGKSNLEGGKTTQLIGGNRPNKKAIGLKPKDLLGIPWRVALALQSDGWYLRSDIVWSKPNCMPESVTDRPTRAHEYVFLLAKSARYFYDAAAITEPCVRPGDTQTFGGTKGRDYQPTPDDPNFRNGSEQWGRTVTAGTTRNKRTVWSISSQPYSGAHYATMPEALIDPCILAGSAARACEHCGAAWGRVVERTGASNEANEVGKGSDVPGIEKNSSADRVRRLSGSTYQHVTRGTDRFAARCTCEGNTGSARSVVLDPFAGSGTVLRVAARYQRDAIGIELNQEYIEQHVERRTNGLQIEMFT